MMEIFAGPLLGPRILLMDEVDSPLHQQEAETELLSEPSPPHIGVDVHPSKSSRSSRSPKSPKSSKLLKSSTSVANPEEVDYQTIISVVISVLLVVGGGLTWHAFSKSFQAPPKQEPKTTTTTLPDTTKIVADPDEAAKAFLLDLYDINRIYPLTERGATKLRLCIAEDGGTPQSIYLLPMIRAVEEAEKFKPFDRPTKPPPTVQFKTTKKSKVIQEEFQTTFNPDAPPLKSCLRVRGGEYSDTEGLRSVLRLTYWVAERIWSEGFLPSTEEVLASPFAKDMPRSKRLLATGLAFCETLLAVPRGSATHERMLKDDRVEEEVYMSVQEGPTDPFPPLKKYKAFNANEKGPHAFFRRPRDPYNFGMIISSLSSILQSAEEDGSIETPFWADKLSEVVAIAGSYSGHTNMRAVKITPNCLARGAILRLFEGHPSWHPEEVFGKKQEKHVSKLIPHGWKQNPTEFEEQAAPPNLKSIDKVSTGGAGDSELDEEP